MNIYCNAASLKSQPIGDIKKKLSRKYLSPKQETFRNQAKYHPSVAQKCRSVCFRNVSRFV
ncbi:CLUMA_CG000560, isoform A [Clunio marinus]|uniref:CLUMA_CG000560, isoform A n=1 Tax=Clunio marinus TaxID=568069 RepID=A0A1J1HFI1_9DIPT|nr:CLUMA_CG000560, isoform A [Clunio marinus]